MFTTLMTFAYLTTSMTTKSQPAEKVESMLAARPDYMQRVDAHVEALFTPERIAEYKRLGLM